VTAKVIASPATGSFGVSASTTSTGLADGTASSWPPQPAAIRASAPINAAMYRFMLNDPSFFLFPTGCQTPSDDRFYSETRLD
jgi:hypothetical protein